jgi:hypothetical protein
MDMRTSAYKNEEWPDGTAGGIIELFTAMTSLRAAELKDWKIRRGRREERHGFGGM